MIKSIFILGLIAAAFLGGYYTSLQIQQNLGLSGCPKNVVCMTLIQNNRNPLYEYRRSDYEK